jgi:hypothetical protein
VFPEEMQGTPIEKVRPIEWERRWHVNKEKVVKEGSDREHLLNETENSLRSVPMPVMIMVMTVVCKTIPALK